MSTVNEVDIDDDFIVVQGSDNVIDVAKAITTAGVADAVVVDDKQMVLGVLDDYDIVSKVLAEEKDPKSVKAEDIMYSAPRVKLETTLTEVYESMQQQEASMLPVVDDDNKLIGVITINDVLESMMGNKSSFLDRLGRLFTG